MGEDNELLFINNINLQYLKRDFLLLIDKYKFSFDSLATLSNLEVNDLKEFYENQRGFTYEESMRLADVVSFFMIGIERFCIRKEFIL